MREQGAVHRQRKVQLDIRKWEWMLVYPVYWAILAGGWIAERTGLVAGWLKTRPYIRRVGPLKRPE